MSEAKWRTLLRSLVNDAKNQSRGFYKSDSWDAHEAALAAEVERIEHERDGLRRVIDGPNPGNASPLASDLVWITREELAKLEVDRHHCWHAVPEEHGPLAPVQRWSDIEKLCCWCGATKKV